MRHILQTEPVTWGDVFKAWLDNGVAPEPMTWDQYEALKKDTLSTLDAVIAGCDCKATGIEGTGRCKGCFYLSLGAGAFLFLSRPVEDQAVAVAQMQELLASSGVLDPDPSSIYAGKGEEL